jgi:hypothetical protein
MHPDREGCRVGAAQRASDACMHMSVDLVSATAGRAASATHLPAGGRALSSRPASASADLMYTHR